MLTGQVHAPRAVLCPGIWSHVAFRASRSPESLAGISHQLAQQAAQERTERVIPNGTSWSEESPEGVNAADSVSSFVAFTPWEIPRQARNDNVS